MRVLHVITGMRKAAGTSVFCGELANGLAAAGHEVTIAVGNPLCSNSYPLDPRVKLVSISSLLTTNHSALTTNDQRLTANDYTLVHIHALWSPILHKVAKWAHKNGIPVVWSPHGMITPWAMNNKKWKKFLGWWLYQRWDLAKAALLHATAESEVEDIRRMGLKNKVVVAPLGVSIDGRVGGNVPGKSLVVSRQSLAGYVGESGNSENYLRRAQEKVGEWLAGMSAERFAAALDGLLDRKLMNGEYRFKGVGGREAMREGAVRFFKEFSRRIVQLSDGRCVYFAPDDRARKRNSDNAVSWAEYAVHAVTNGGRRLPGKTYNERWLNYHKISAFEIIESTLLLERCVVRRNEDARYDAIMFVGDDVLGMVVNVVARLDDFGNIDANLTEVTFEASSRKVKKAPRLMPLAEAVETVVHRQVAAGSNPSTDGSIAYSVQEHKGARCLLFVSRVQRKKGLANLAMAWAELPKDVRNGWKVRIVGPDQENHMEELKSLCAELGVAQDFDFVGPKYDDELQHEYDSADLFVLPTHSENFGSVVIEALAHGVPVITTKGTPWHELEGYANSQLSTPNFQLKCGWWIDIGVPPLVAALKDAMSLSDEARSEMGGRGRRLVEEKYTWEAVVKKMVNGYEALVQGQVVKS